MTGGTRIQHLSKISLDCLNPDCGKAVEYQWERPGPATTWADIPDKVTLRCDSCGVTGEYHPKHTRGGKPLGWH